MLQNSEFCFSLFLPQTSFKKILKISKLACSFLLLIHLPVALLHHISVVLSAILLMSPNDSLSLNLLTFVARLPLLFPPRGSHSAAIPSPGMACMSHPGAQQLPPPPQDVPTAAAATFTLCLPVHPAPRLPLSLRGNSSMIFTLLCPLSSFAIYNPNSFWLSACLTVTSNIYSAVPLSKSVLSPLISGTVNIHPLLFLFLSFFVLLGYPVSPLFNFQ